jgi:hypothetical protein
MCAVRGEQGRTSNLPAAAAASAANVYSSSLFERWLPCSLARRYNKFRLMPPRLNSTRWYHAVRVHVGRITPG